MTLQGFCRTVGFAALVGAMFGLPSAAEAFWASHGSYGSSGSYGSAASYGSRGSWGSRASYGSSASHGSSASSGSSASYGSSASHGSSSSHGYVGPIRRLFSRLHASHGSSASNGSSASHGSSSSHGSHSSHGGYTVHSSHSSHGSASSHGSTGSHGGYSTPVIYSEPTIIHETPVIHSAPVIHSGSASRTAPPQTIATGSGTLRVSVPADAQVFVNDNATTSTGADRHYVSNGLKQGESYTYKVRVEYLRDGQPVVENKVATLTMGSDVRLDFNAGQQVVADREEAGEADEEASRVTALNLRLPTDARVTLAGAATRQTGAERSFRTTRLAAGETWDNYVVAVEVDRNGETLRKEQVITLTGGESHELAFDFADTGLKLAAAN